MIRVKVLVCARKKQTNKEEVRVENCTSVVSKSPMCELRRATAGPTNGSQSLQEENTTHLTFVLKLLARQTNSDWKL